MGSDITSDAVSLEFIILYSIQFSWTGTAPVGTITLEASNDGVAWTTITDSATAISGATGDGVIEYSLAGHKIVRAKYTRASGTGTLNATINLKG